MTSSIRATVCAAAIVALGTMPVAASAASLYVDTTTKQVFTEPGPGRVALGELTGAPDQASLKVDKKGLTVSSGDGDFTLKIGGRIHADATTHLGDDELTSDATSGTEIRRARLNVSGSFYRDFSYVIEGDFAGNGVSMKDTLIAYTTPGGIELAVGHQKHAISMEIEESSNDIMFHERSLVSALTVPHFDRALGVTARTGGDDWSMKGGIYGDSMSSSAKNTDEGGGWGLRGSFAPVNDTSAVVHLGASVGQRRTDDSNTTSNGKSARLRYETTHMSDLYLSDTGNIAGFDTITLAGVEFAAVAGPFSFQAEFARADVSRDAGDDTDYTAYYLQGAWSLTGESRRYKGSEGEFKRLVPHRRFDPSSGCTGAWELALRLDALDLDSDDINGGQQQRLTLNLNWYLNDNIRVLMGYSRAYDVDAGPVTRINGDDADNIDVFQLRGQVAF